MSKREAMRVNKIGMKKMIKINNNSKRTNRKPKKNLKINSNLKMMDGSSSKRKNEKLKNTYIVNLLTYFTYLFLFCLFLNFSII